MIDNEETIKNLPAAIREKFEEIDEIAEFQYECPIKLLDGYEGGLVGYMERGDGIVAVYDYDKSIEYLASTYSDEDVIECNPDLTDEQKADSGCLDDLRRSMAIEWYEYNTARAIPYEGESAPVVIHMLGNR